MATAYTSLLGLALPVTGELSGTWGSTVNTEITALLDSAIAGTTTLSTDADVTLTTTTGAANTSRQAILLCSGARTVLRTITAPAQSKIYTIINATTGGFSVKLVGAGPTTGLTIPNGASAVVAWNGSDFIEIGSATVGNFTVNGTLTVTGVATFSAGTAALPAITTTGDTNTGIFFPAADTIAFSEGGVEAMRIDSSGNVGIGTSSPSSKLDVSGVVSLQGTTLPSAGTARLYSRSSDSSFYMQPATGGSIILLDGLQNSMALFGSSLIQFLTGNTERMRIDSSGNVGIGTSSPSYKLHVRGTDATAVLVVGNTSEGTQLEVLTYQDDKVVLRSNDTSNVARTLAFETGTTEAARIDSNGNLLVGTTSQFQTSRLSVSGTGNVGDFRTSSASGYPVVCENSATGSTNMVIFLSGASFTTVGSITYNGSLTLYNTTSDQRLKENIQDAESASSLIDSLKVRKFDWKESNIHQRYGFVAQELVTVAPEAVHQPTDPDEMMAVDYSKLVPMLVKEIQSLRQRVAQLESN